MQLNLHEEQPSEVSPETCHTPKSHLQKSDSDQLVLKTEQCHHRLINMLDKVEYASKLELPAEEELSLTPLQIKMGWLENIGYTSLAKRLRGKRHSIWESICQLSTPIFIEQLSDLYHLLQYQKAKVHSNPILLWCLKIAQESTNDTSLCINEAIAHIGKVIFLADKDIVDLCKHINNNDREATFSWIDQKFKEGINVNLKRIIKHFKDHQKAKLQSPDVATNTFLPLEISRALFTNIGTINIGIIDPLIEFFIKDYQHPLNYEINLVNGLKLLQKSSSLREKFGKITAPKMDESPANDVIRVVLGLPKKTEINDNHAKLTILTGLLSHLRQAPTGSCFAESLAIELLSSHLGQCLDDFTCLLRDGKLTRKVKDTTVEFPFLLRIDNQNLDNPISMDAHYWKSPGFVSAGSILEISHLKTTIFKLIPELLKEDSPTVKSLLKLLALHAANEQGLDAGDLFSKACFAFEAQTTCALLKVWRNVIAGMAEAEEGGMIKSAIISSAMKSLDVTFKGLNPKQLEWKEELYETLRAEMLFRIQLQYDPAIPSKNIDNHHSPEGAFVLHDKREKRFNRFIPINSPTLFQEWVTDCLQHARNKMKISLFNHEKVKITHRIVKRLSGYIKKKLFIKNILHFYHPDNKNIDQYEGIDENLQYTPWITKTGNDTGKVFDVYFEKTAGERMVKIFPASAEDLLTKIIEIGRKMPPKEQQYIDENPFVLLPFRIHQYHSFSLMLGHTSLKNAWHQERSASNWIQEYVISPGTALSNFLIDPQTLQRMIEISANSIHLQDKKNEFIKKMQESEQKFTYQEFRRYALSLIQTVDPKPGEAAAERKRLFDSLLCQNLPDDLQKTFQESAVHFADTNWSEGVHDIHFCFAVNPGTGKLEIWEAYDNGTQFQALDQNYWMLNRTWEFYPHPEHFFCDISSNIS